MAIQIFFQPFIKLSCLFSYYCVLRVFNVFLDVNLLLDMHFENIFSQSVARLFLESDF